MLAIRIKGFSLLECLLAMGLFAWILLLCEGMFVIQQKAGMAVVHDIERMDMVRQFMLRLEPLVMRAGFLGMQSLASGLPLVVHGDMSPSHLPTSALTIHHAAGSGWSPPLPTALKNKVAKGTDVLILESAGPWHAMVQSFSTELGITIAASSRISSGWFVIADGQQADIFWGETKTQGEYTYIKPAVVLPSYKNYAVVSPWQIVSVYVQTSEDGFALMQKSLWPAVDAVNLLTSLEAFQCEREGSLLKLRMMHEAESFYIWLGSDNASA